MSKQRYKLTCQICGKNNVFGHAKHLKCYHQITTQEYYNKFLKKENDGVCKTCNGKTPWSGRLALGYCEFCSKNCANCYRMGKSLKPHSSETKEKMRQKRLAYCQTEAGKQHNAKLSRDRKGANNPSHKQTAETRERVRKISQERMLLKIKNGYTPPITNSWCHSKVQVNGKQFRSTWEAVFYILNPHLEYEKIKISYFNPITSDVRTYIVDFVDEKTKTLYEIKPQATLKHVKNIAKEKAARKWSKINGYNFICISNSFFEKNAKKIDFSLYDSKIYKNMKQFLK
jgi:hypothetical protein